MLICLVVVEMLLKYIQKHFVYGSYSDRFSIRELAVKVLSLVIKLIFRTPIEGEMLVLLVLSRADRCVCSDGQNCKIHLPRKNYAAKLLCV